MSAKHSNEHSIKQSNDYIDNKSNLNQEDCTINFNDRPSSQLQSNAPEAQNAAKQNKWNYNTTERIFFEPAAYTPEKRHSAKTLALKNSSQFVNEKRISLFGSNSYLNLKELNLGGSHFDAGPSIYLKQQQQNQKKQELLQQQQKEELKAEKSATKTTATTNGKATSTIYQTASSTAFLTAMSSLSRSKLQSQLSYHKSQQSKSDNKNKIVNAAWFARLWSDSNKNVTISMPMFELLPKMTTNKNLNTNLLYQNAYILDGINYEYSLHNVKKGRRAKLKLDYKKFVNSLTIKSKPSDCDVVFGNAKIIILNGQNWENSRIDWLYRLEGKDELPKQSKYKYVKNWYDDEDNLIENCCFSFIKQILK